MGPYQNIDLAFFKRPDHLLLMLLADKARQRLHTNRPIGKPISKVLKMLLSQKGCGNQDGDLSAILNGHKGGTHRNLGFPKTYITADDAVHRFGR